jgi:hypothetical protein
MYPVTALIVLLLASIGALAGLALLLLGGVLQALSVKEAEVGIQEAASWLLRRIEERLPSRHRRRFREETAAGLQELSQARPLWGFVQALSLFRSTLLGRLAADFETAEGDPPENVGAPTPTPVKVPAHPARMQILRRLKEEPASAKELAASLAQPVANTTYHFQLLKRCGLIEVVRTEQIRGINREFYRATGAEPHPE